MMLREGEEREEREGEKRERENKHLMRELKTGISIYLFGALTV